LDAPFFPRPYFCTGPHRVKGLARLLHVMPDVPLRVGIMGMGALMSGNCMLLLLPVDGMLQLL
jgi:hypothetical protein